MSKDHHLSRLSFAIEALSNPAPIPNRINEDAWLVLETAVSPGFLIAAVIDGAGARLTLPALQAALAKYHNGLSPAAFAANLVRRSLSAQFNETPDLSLSAAVLNANALLRTAVSTYIGGFAPEQILAQANQPSDTDPRQMRLALPACVATVIRINLSEQSLEYVHAGDTSLLEIQKNGRVIQHTTDQMGQYDQVALQLANQIRQEKKLPHIVDAIRHPAVRQQNQLNGLRHNFVDTNGNTHAGNGCGVINGLPELSDYLEQGSIPISPTQTDGYCLLSDGLELLAPLNESAEQHTNRLQQTGTILMKQGVRGLLATVSRQAESDPQFDQYPRMKMQDDATGILLRIIA